MPRTIIQYRVFIASPGGLEDERRRFRHVLDKYTARDAEPRGVAFHPVGWEETVCGVGRPQALINEDIKQCDYAVFVLHDRWGSPTGNGHASGTEEEWKLAEELYEAIKIRNIALFFKNVDHRQLKDPGEQLRKVLDFRKRIMEGRKYLFKDFLETNDFGELVENQLAQWLRDHEKAAKADFADSPTSPTVPPGKPAPKPSSPAAPTFAYWIAEAERLGAPDVADNAGAEFCAHRAAKEAKSDVERAGAFYALGMARVRLGKFEEAMADFTAVIDDFATSRDPERWAWFARCLNGKGLSLGRLGRREAAITVCDEALARFGTASELPLREQVARALVNKGWVLGELGRNEETITVCDEVLTRFGAASELPLREQVARAQFNKGATLNELGRNEEAIDISDEVLARFGTASGLPVQEEVARALVNKGYALGELGRNDEALTLYDEVQARFGAAMEAGIRELVDISAQNKKVLEKRQS